jgi:bifunctional UDP-N-acetylglucosamine pyrophosphorylase/glucosamine-1-phosphate N-acetyltransferase
VESAVFEKNSQVGPFARIRPGTKLSENVRIGNFVETKNSQFAANSKANHLSYIGDAIVGESSNVGAGTITCNYDGFMKHQTKIGSDVFIGSNTSLVAPVELGNGAMVAAGSVITKSVPADGLAVERSEQKNIDNAARRFRARRRK